MAHPPEGTFLAVPLPDGSFGYVRALLEPYYALYRFRTPEAVTDLDELERQPVLTRLAVRRVRGRDKWRVLGARPLTGAIAEPVLQFMQDIADPTQCTIFDTAGMSRPASPQECVGIERASVWETHHVEARILDDVLGRPNPIEIAERVQLP